MNKTKKRSFTALLCTLVCALVLALSLGIFCACDKDESATVGGNASEATWYYGDAEPADGLGKAGDYYLNTETLASYVKEGKTWRAASADETGNWFTGKGNPDGSLGDVNDFYLDLGSGELYHKTEGGWGSPVVVLKGQNGRDGVKWFSGEKEPATGDSDLMDARKGDFYLKTDDFTVWQLVEKDGELTWSKLGSIKPEDGATGPDGKSAYELYVEQYKTEHGSEDGMLSEKDWLASLKGEQGEQGKQGETGKTGDQGPIGPDGKSAYELYVEQYKAANEGSEEGMLTEAQWLESLKGEQGEQGKQGEQGEQGDQGPIGPDGKSAYELYVEQYKATHEDENYLSEQEWLESLKGDKGDKGDPGKDSVHFYYGDGKPGDEITEKAVEGDLYVGRFSGTDGTSKGSGSILYVFHNGAWEVLMENITPATISIFSLEKLIEFSNLVAEGKIADGAEVHLKADINFGGTEGMSMYSALAVSAVEWTPIGTTAHPFNGTFDGEGHTITGLTVSGANAGLFAVTEDASIKNLTIVDATVEAKTNGKAGILVAEAKGTLEVKNVNVENGTVKAAEEATDTTLGALVGSAEGADKVTVGDVTVELTEDSAPTQEDKPFVGSGDVTYSPEGESSLKSDISDGFAQKVDLAHGNKTSYEITSLEGFRAFRSKVNDENKTFEGETVYLATEIGLSGEENWEPIGKKDGTLFQGTFDGQGNIISNLTITGGQDYAGLFNSTGSALFKNLTLNTVHIEGGAYVGSLVGFGWTSKFEGINVNGAVLTGNHWMGGISGGSYSSFTDCHVDGLTITCTPNDVGEGVYDNGDKVGGLTGLCESGTFYYRNCSVMNATLTGYRDIGAFAGCAHTGHVENSELKSVKIVVDWETNFYGQKDVNAANYYGYIGRDDHNASTVDAASQKYESEVTVEYKGIMAKVGNKVYANVQDAFYAVYDMGPEADEQGDIVIELLQDVDLKTTDLKEINAPSKIQTWIDASGVFTNGHKGFNGKEMNQHGWPTFTFDGKGHDINLVDEGSNKWDNLSGNSNYFIYTGANYDKKKASNVNDTTPGWSITFKNFNVNGGGAQMIAFEIQPIETPIINSQSSNFFASEIVFENVDVTGDWNKILHMPTRSIVTLDGCNFTNTLNEKPYSNGNNACAVDVVYSSQGSSLYLKNGSYISSVFSGYYSSYSGYSRVYVDATSSMNYEWLLATFKVNNYVVQGAFIFDGDAPEALQLTDANKFEFTYEQQSQAKKLFSSRIQDGGKETQWFLDTEVAAELNALLV